MTRLAIIGAAELGKLLTHHAQASGEFRVEGYYDDRASGTFNGLAVLGPTERIEDDHASGRFDALAMGIGYNHMAVRAAIFERFSRTIPFANIIHPSCYVDPSCTLGQGLVLLPRTVLDMEARVDDNVLLNTGVIIAHNAHIGPHCFLAPGVHVAGLVTVGEGSFLGIGSTIISGVAIAPWSLVGAGSVVIRDTAPHSVSVGVPSRPIRTSR